MHRTLKLAFLSLWIAVWFSAASAAGELWLEPRVSELPGIKAGPYVKLSDGSLLTVEGDFTYVTRDDGKTWLPPRPLFAAGQNLKVSNERSLLRTSGGTIILSFINRNTSRWKWDDEKNEPVGKWVGNVWIIQSRDEGKTWQGAQMVQEGYCGAVPHLIQIRSGRVLLIAQDFFYDPGRHVSRTYSSDDDGETWKASNYIDLGGRGHHDGAIEGTATELNDGRIWMLLRTNWDRFWEAYSDDGRYWRTIFPSKIDASSSPGCLRRLASGRLVLAWNRLRSEGKTEVLRRPSGPYAEESASWQREELSVAFSEDDGVSWTAPVVIARQPKARQSYPWIFERRSGELWITTMQGHLHVKLHEKKFLGPHSYAGRRDIAP